MSAEPIYHLVYDAAQTSLPVPLPQLTFVSAIGVIMISVGIFYVVRPDALVPRTPETEGGRRGQRIFIIFWLSFVCLLFALAIGSILINHASLAAASRDGTCKRVEGVVTDYREGKGVRFTVAGVKFDYSSASLTGGYNDSGWFSSPVQGGMQVRICYAVQHKDNVIVRLEIADQR